MDLGFDCLRFLLLIEQMANPNVAIRDRMIARSVRVTYRSLANEVAVTLERRIAPALARQTFNGLKRIRRRGRGVVGRIGVQRLLERNRRLIRREFEKVWREILEPGLLRVGAAEAKWTQAMLSKVFGVELSPADAADLARRIRTGRMSKATVRAWFRTVEARLIADSERVIREGLKAGDTAEDIVRGLTGTRRRKGVFRDMKRHARTIADSAVVFVRNQATAVLGEANPGKWDRERWTSVLDERTSLICIDLDGQVFAVGEGPYPPAHPNCRSIRIPIDESDTIPEKQTYREWLSGRPAEFQDEVLGPTRGAEFRRLLASGRKANSIRFANVKQLKPLRVAEFERQNRRAS